MIQELENEICVLKIRRSEININESANVNTHIQPDSNMIQSSDSETSNIHLELLNYKKAMQVAIPMLKELRDLLDMKQRNEIILSNECAMLRARLREEAIESSNQDNISTLTSIFSNTSNEFEEIEGILQQGDEGRGREDEELRCYYNCKDSKEKEYDVQNEIKDLNSKREESNHIRSRESSCLRPKINASNGEILN
mmetsp:Transcript_18024/g.25945  ORF Transcript_18024/g.25945 Transcript_18024/m.25945 type:complete len:197 (+) Transcript_18024:359-949(+)